MRQVKCLVEQPAIHDEIERIVGRADLHGAERLVPHALDRGERGLRLRQRGIARGQLDRVRPVAPLAEDERHAARFAGLDLERELQGSARVEPGAGAPGEPLAEERGRRAQRAIASDELAAVPGVRSRCLRGAPERHASAEVGVVGVARQHDAGRVVHLRDHEAPLAGARRPETPLDVAEHADALPHLRGVGQCQHAPASRDPPAPRRPPVPAGRQRRHADTA